jgi:MoaA/NifB/PqqE/SkfB family radical SAM enzyme
MRLTTKLKRLARGLPKAVGALVDRHHPLLVHIIPMRRCNLACSYCNEYDSSSSPVATDLMLTRIDHLGRLGTAFVTFSGGEPLMHPDLDQFVARARQRRMVVTLITNGYHLSPERIDRLNEAGLDHLQISIDNVEPDDSSKKSLRLLEPKLRWLAEHADFSVAINSVLGSGVARPEDALMVARRARDLGFMTSLGIIHDGRGQLKPLGPREMKVYEELRGFAQKGLVRLNHRFQDNLARGVANDWSCRAGARYLYVDEDGMVSYCSQQRGIPGTPLESYGLTDIRREYATRKDCAPYCTVNCVQQVGLFDNWRSPQEHLARLPRRPAAEPEVEAGQDDRALAG